MKIHIVSDLHLEFGEIILPEVERDILVIAGDLHIGTNGLEFIEEQCEISPVLYVLGNHEFYKNEYTEILNYWRNINIPNLYFLQNNSVSIDDFTFLGTTLWTDMNSLDADSVREARSGLNDYQMIRLNSKILEPEDTFHIFMNSIRWLYSKLGKSEIEKTIVVTHHLPSYKSVAPQFANSPLNPCFASDLDYIFDKYEIPLWIHGHTHVNFDYMINKTQIICNPRGYAGYEKNNQFKPDLVIDI